MGLQSAFAAKVAPMKTTWIKTFKVQAWAYGFILPRLYPSDAYAALGPTIARRLWQNFGIDPTLHHPQSLLPLLCTLKPHCAMCVIKTWVNGWTTSDRMHEPDIKPCIFGCANANDILSHYVHCTKLWTTVTNITGFVPIDLLERLAISVPTPTNFHNIVVAYSTYHMCKSTTRAGNTSVILATAHDAALAAHRRFAPNLTVYSVR